MFKPITLFLLLCSFSFFSYSQNWTVLKTTGVSDSAGKYTDIAVGPDNSVYVAYQDEDNMKKITVRKWTGSAWDVVGSAGLSKDIADHTSLTVDKNGVIYVAFSDLGNTGKLSVMKFSSNAWDTVGSAGFSGGTTSFNSIAVNSSGIPYVAFQDGANGGKLTVKKFSSGTWSTVGSVGISSDVASHISLRFNSSDEPFVCFRDAGNSDKAYVLKFDGSTWNTLGSSSVSAGGINYCFMALDGSGNPWVVYTNPSNSNKNEVMKFNGTGWSAVGSSVSSGTAFYNCITFSNDTAVLVYMDVAAGGKATACKWDGSSWNVLGSAAYTKGSSTFHRLAVNTYGVIYHACSEASDLAKAYVYKFGIDPTFTVTTSVTGSGGTISPAGNKTVNAGDSLVVSITPSSGFCTDSVFVDGKHVPGAENSSQYIFRNIQKNHTISASFMAEVTPSVNLTASATTITTGQSVTFTATPQNPGPSPMYGFIVNRLLKQASANNTYTTTSLNNFDTVWVVMIANNKCQSLDTVISFPIRMNVVAGINEMVKGNYQISPNPFCSYISVLLDKPGMVRITDLSGKLIYDNKLLSSGVQNIQLDHINAGVYFISVDGFVQKIIKE